MIYYAIFSLLFALWWFYLNYHYDDKYKQLLLGFLFWPIIAGIFILLGLSLIVDHCLEE